jgi:hypothetical protein
MENINEIRIILNEDSFTHICKCGFFTIRSVDYGKTDIHFHKVDIIQLTKGEVVTKETGVEFFKFIVTGIELETLREIVKRSPIFYELSNQF